MITSLLAAGHTIMILLKINKLNRCRGKSFMARLKTSSYYLKEIQNKIPVLFKF